MSGPILVTGASGFVGERLARRLARASHPVVGTYRERPISIPDVETIAIDLSEPDAVRQLVERTRPATVFHCAAQTDIGFCQRDPRSARSAIVAATDNLLAAVVDVSPEIPFVTLSTDLVFAGDRAPYRENDVTVPLSNYGSFKLQAETLTIGLPHGIALRSALVLGPPGTHGGGFLTWMIDALRAGKERTLFEDEYRTPIAIDDLCAAMIALAEQRYAGIWHAGGPDRLNRYEMGIALCAAFGFDSRLLKPARQAESQLAAPRPCDVSLDSSRLWQTVAIEPQPFALALSEMARGDHAPEQGAAQP